MKKVISLLLMVILALTLTVSLVSAGSVSSFTIVDSRTNLPLGSEYTNIVSDKTISLDDIPRYINVVANIQGSDVDSVKFMMNGNAHRVENYDPYALNGDLYSNYYDWEPRAQTYRIQAIPYTRNNAQGTAGSGKTISLTFTQGSYATKNSGSGQINDFYLVNSRSNSIIKKLNSGDVINLNEVGTDLNIKAETSNDVESVKFYLNGVDKRTENIVPYALVGDIASNYYTWNPQGQTYEIRAVPFSQDNARGTQGESKSISVTFSTSQPSSSNNEGSFGSQGIYLVNSQTDQIIKKLNNGDVINLNDVGTKLNLVAHFDRTYSSASMYVDGTYEGSEAELPFSFFKDTNANYWDWTPSTKSYTFRAVPQGGSEISVSVSFTRSGSGGSESSGSNSGSNSGSSGSDSTIDDSNNIVPPIDGFNGDNLQYPDPVAETVKNIDNGEDGFLRSEFKKWHRVEILFEGPDVNENSNPNPFLDYRLDVVFFSPSGKRYFVPGHYAADGNAANTGATSGNKWRVYFTPDEIGEWTYGANFRQGEDIAVHPNPNAGTPISFNGASGSFVIEPTNKVEPDFRSKGRLSYVGEHYLQFEETKEFFIKGGSDAPENLLAYADFDNTPNRGGRRKTWSPHVNDWNNGDPTWMGGKGKGLIGAVNYMAEEGMNVMSFLTMNVDGDDENVYPYIEYDASRNPSEKRRRIDVSKVDQWDIVFAHMQKNGIYLHFKTQETENDDLLDNGDLGTERKLYYRELISRFGYHLALNWNTGEENTQSNDNRKAMAEFFKELDPYQHNRVIHTYPNQQNIYDNLLGSQSEYTGASLQNGWNQVYAKTSEWVKKSAQSGKKWVVANDEQGSANCGVPPDSHSFGGSGRNGQPCNVDIDGVRKETVWGNLMAGGAGVEFYFGYQLDESDLTAQDFRSRDQMWDYTRYALFFFNNFLPFEEMSECQNILDDGDWCLGKTNDIYVFYTKNDKVQADIPVGSYTAYWYNPREGIFQGSPIAFSGSQNKDFGRPPFGGDGALLVVRDGYEYTPSGIASPYLRGTDGSINDAISAPSSDDDSTNDEPSSNDDVPNTGSSTGVFKESDGLVVVEAESFYEQTENLYRKWEFTSNGVTPDPDGNHQSGASGNEYLELLPDTRVTHEDPLETCKSFNNNPNECEGSRNILKYKVDIQKTGRYYVWVRAYSTGSEDNGIHVGLNGDWPSTGQRLQWCSGKNTWYWESKQRTNANHCGEAKKIYLDINTPGEHTIMFSMREDGFEFDKFILEHTSRGYNRPTGDGPFESNRE